MKKVLHALFCIVLLAAAVGTRVQAQTTPGTGRRGRSG